METKTQKEMAEYIVKWLIDNGWTPRIHEDVEQIVVTQSEYYKPSICRWVSKSSIDADFVFSINDILFDHEVAKKIFGEEPTFQGLSVLSVILYFKQVAVKHLGKIIAVGSTLDDLLKFNRENPPHPDLEWESIIRESEAKVGKGEIEKYEYRLRSIQQSIPIDTHRLEDIQTSGDIPAWQYHLQQMVISDNPVKYVYDYLINKDKER